MERVTRFMRRGHVMQADVIAYTLAHVVPYILGCLSQSKFRVDGKIRQKIERERISGHS